MSKDDTAHAGMTLMLHARTLLGRADHPAGNSKVIDLEDETALANDLKPSILAHETAHELCRGAHGPALQRCALREEHLASPPLEALRSPAPDRASTLTLYLLQEVLVSEAWVHATGRKGRIPHQTH
ncbi:hypothetical protein MMC29_003110 [Sticta canariensis]|nr:hypothetical protein [Sticta canariensis]